MSKPSSANSFLHAVPIGEIHALHAEVVVIVEDRRPRVFERDVVIVIEVIETDDGIAALQQLLRGMEADESGSARNEDLHAVIMSV